MYEIDCCGMNKDGMCLENNVPCKDIEWRHCTVKAVEYAENKELEIKCLKERYKTLLLKIKDDMEQLYLFTLPYYSRSNHFLADVVRNKILTNIEGELDNEQSTNRD